MTKMSRRELGRIAAAATMARVRPLAAQTAASNYIGPLTGVSRGLDDRRFDPVVYARERYDAAPRRMRFQARTRAAGRDVAAGAASEGDRAPGRLPNLSFTAAAGDARDAHISRLPAREDRLRQPAGRQRARLSSVAGAGAASGGDRHLRARPRPRRRRHRRHRRTGPRSDGQVRLPARLCHPGRGSRSGGGGDRADGVRLPPRSAQRASRSVAQGLRAGGWRRLAARRDDDRLAGVGRDPHARLHRDPAGTGCRPRRLHGHLGRRHDRRCFRRRSSRAFERRWSAAT